MTESSLEKPNWPVFRSLASYRRGDLPHTERIADTTVTLPLFPTMSEADVDRVCAACADLIGGARATTAS